MNNSRRYDLDWLRVIVFGLLIFYHVGMFFVPWGWHIKNEQSYSWLTYPMLFVNQWRLPILFVISGMGTAYALAFRSVRQFAKERLQRLFIPLIFGMIVIVPPQVYVERIADGDYAGSYLDWILSGLFISGVYPEGNLSWHHLWFLPYLLIFSLILAPVFIWIRENPNNRFINFFKSRLDNRPIYLFVLAVPLYLYEVLLEPFFETTHNLVWDWFNFISSMTLFFYGFLLISAGKSFWLAVDRIWKKCLIVGIISFLTLLFIWTSFEDGLLVHLAEALIKVTNLWAWILSIFGFASKKLNWQSGKLSYANQAVYPFYILHQTVTVLIGFWLYDLGWGFVPKFAILVIGTLGVSFMIYEFIIRRNAFLWPLFGLKKRSESGKLSAKATVS